MNLTKTPYLVLFIILVAVGVGSASALMTITLAGSVAITEGLTVDTDTLVVDAGNDRVGIGTGTPLNPLDINTDGKGVSMRLFDDGQLGILYDQPSTGTKFFEGIVATGDKYILGDAIGGVSIGIDRPTGNVGIGTLNPTSKLHVDGTITGIGTVPIGTILPFAGTIAPDGYLLANGAAVSRTTYSELSCNNNSNCRRIY